MLLKSLVKKKTVYDAMHNICDNDTAINVIIEGYKNHPSVTKSKEIIEKKTLLNVPLSLTLLQSLI